MFKTWVTEKLGIEYPVIQGAMQWLAKAELASAVTNAGGLGIIAAGSFHTAEELRQEIRKAKTLTDRPFAVNFTLMPTRRPVVWEEYISAALEEGVSIIETSGRSPEPYMEWLRAARVKVLHKVARIRDALTAERLGVDAVTLIGYEAGGHPGMEDVTSLVLIPKAVDSLKIPVIAGGGFADGRGLVAALALGAQGVVMGTRFMASQECPMHPRIKERLLQTGETDTMMLERSIQNAARVIKTDFAQRVLAMEERGATLEELFPMLDGNRVRRSYQSGDTDDSVLYCGQAVGLINEIPSVKEIIDRIIKEAREVVGRLEGMGINF
jgi:NAD(P)H-dependent flavin oxidoreductase YrpB (nitropropane dioxygenase family)